MTRRELTAAIRGLPDEEKLDLLCELWDLLDQEAAPPDWHKEELDRRLANTEGASFSIWAEARARIVGSK